MTKEYVCIYSVTAILLFVGIAVTKQIEAPIMTSRAFLNILSVYHVFTRECYGIVIYDSIILLFI